MQFINNSKFTIWVAVLFTAAIISSQVHASHRAMLFNENAMEKILDVWPNFVESVDNQARGMEAPGDRGLLVPSPLRSHLNSLLQEQPSPEMVGEGFERLANEIYLPAGRTSFASRVNTAAQVTALNYVLRNTGRLPVRFAYSYDLARQPLSTSHVIGLYEMMGSMWQGIESNPWMWLHGMSSEGDWDAPNRGCFGDDLMPKPGVDVEYVKQTLEICPDFNAPAVQALMRGLRSGWRFAGVHGVGSHAIRLFVQQLESAMERNPGHLTLENVRKMRNGFAHGHMVGKVPDVMQSAIHYNLYIPVSIQAAIVDEVDNINATFGEAGYEFLAPVRSLLDAGVKVVGETEIGRPNPQTYFQVIDLYVNREFNEDGLPPAEGEAGTVYVASEGIDRVEALKLLTYRSAEFMYAESKIGSLEVGKFADFVISEKNLLSGPDHQIRNNKVIMTVLDGEIVYEDPEHPADIQ